MLGSARSGPLRACEQGNGSLFTCPQPPSPALLLLALPPHCHGERAGFINKPFDLMCMDAMVNDPERLARYSTLDIVREAGAQGTELMAWIAARGALTGRVSKVHSNYHVPISNTATGMMVLENQPRQAPQVRAA